MKDIFVFPKLNVIKLPSYYGNNSPYIYSNSPINLLQVRTFEKDIHIIQRFADDDVKFPCIVFTFDNTSFIKWIYNYEEDRNLEYDKLIIKLSKDK